MVQPLFVPQRLPAQMGPEGFPTQLASLVHPVEIALFAQTKGVPGTPQCRRQNPVPPGPQGLSRVVHVASPPIPSVSSVRPQLGGVVFVALLHAFASANFSSLHALQVWSWMQAVLHAVYSLLICFLQSLLHLARAGDAVSPAATSNAVNPTNQGAPAFIVHLGAGASSRRRLGVKDVLRNPGPTLGGGRCQVSAATEDGTGQAPSGTCGQRAISFEDAR